MRLTLQTALVVDHSTTWSVTHLNDRIVTRGHIFTGTTHNPGQYAVLRTPTSQVPPNDAVPPTVNGVPPLLLVHAEEPHEPDPEPWRRRGWEAIIFVRTNHPDERPVPLPAETIDFLVLTEHYLHLGLRERNMHALKNEWQRKQYAALARALTRLVRSDINAAHDIFQHADGFHALGGAPRSVLPAIHTLQKHVPQDPQIARAILMEYGATAHQHAGGLAAIDCLQRFGTSSDHALLALHNYGTMVPATQVRDAVYQDPTTLLIPKTKRLIAQGAFLDAWEIAHTVHNASNDSALRVVAARIARDAAWHAGEFDLAHQYGEIALTEATASQPSAWRELREDINRVTESAAYVADDVMQLLSTFPYDDRGDLGRIARESPEYHAVTRGHDVAYEIAHKNPKTPRSLLRLHFLALAEQRASQMGRFTRAYQDAVRQAPPGVREWFTTPSERDKHERFLTPQPRTLGSRIMALHVGQRLYQIGDRRSIRLHAAAAVKHLRGTRRLTAKLSGAFDARSMHVYDTWLSGRAMLHLTLFGRPTAFFDSAKLLLGNNMMELLILLAFHPHGILQADVARQLFDGEIPPGLVRTLVTELRKEVPISESPYRLTVPVVLDYQKFAEAHALADYEELLRNYSSTVFPRSRAPFIVRLRNDVQEKVRNAITQIDNVALLIERQADFAGHTWYRQRLAALLPPDDPRWQLIEATEQQVLDGPDGNVPTGSS